MAWHAATDSQRDARPPREGLIHCADAEGAAIHKDELAAQHKLCGHTAVKLQVAFQDNSIQLRRGNVQQHLAGVHGHSRYGLPCAIDFRCGAPLQWTSSVVHLCNGPPVWCTSAMDLQCGAPLQRTSSVVHLCTGV